MNSIFLLQTTNKLHMEDEECHTQQCVRKGRKKCLHVVSLQLQLARYYCFFIFSQKQFDLHFIALELLNS